MSSTLFDDIFNISEVDTARYNKVSRIVAASTTSADIKITLDVNSDLFPVKVNDSVTVTLASSLSLDGSKDVANTSWRPPKAGEKTLADDYDYVMYGTVYKFEEGKDDKIAVYISFGGLLLCLEGGYRNLSSLKQENVYLLMRR
ncbi:CYFA0S02e01376g1_1 [Cyberlindnera fabianii]|uniref:DNA-directed RNA polymerases I, II, and III subunit RPABC3 n=1 Tax=Cyberlindnera fabianii TaxID=36022 RepID=A0A061AMP2_CYBFA|nr:DNA-directed RNA polymerases I, II, and III subunit RPABC3 [Cyberlindnera fabianii]CDR38410.1 CYFA0S02e01376g1_1 [Cyberlindnera fabianii]